MEIWQSADKNTFAQLFWDTVYNTGIGKGNGQYDHTEKTVRVQERIGHSEGGTDPGGQLQSPENWTVVDNSALNAAGVEECRKELIRVVYN